MIQRIKKALRRRIDALATVDSIWETVAFSRVLIMATALTVILRLGLSRPLFQWLRSVPVADRTTGSDTYRRIVRVTDTVLLLGRPAIRSECLARTCLLYYQMRRAGAHVDMRFGVSIASSEFKSHCWLISDEEPLYEPVDPRSSFRQMFDLNG